MNPYTDYHLSFKPLSPAITMLQSDTLFGHVAWALKYLKSENDLEKFLKTFQDEQDSPFLISDGFRSGYLPKPVLKALPVKVLIKILEDLANEKGYAVDDTLITAFIKALKKQTMIRTDTFKKIQFDFRSEALIKEAAKELDWDEIKQGKSKTKKQVHSNLVVHNTVNRIAWRVTEGLYQQTENFYLDDASFDVYLKTSYFSETDIKAIFGMIEHGGYGRDKSTGKGRFQITITKENRLPEIKDANVFMSLSHFIPNRTMPTEGRYKLMTKYGRLGGDFACSVIPGIEKYYGGQPPKRHPYKKPLLMMQPGAVFWGKPAHQYGLLLGGENRPVSLQIHKFPNIRHYACLFPLGLKSVEEEFKHAIV